VTLSIRALAQQFDPRRIANLTGWFDALDSAGYTASSNRVSDWLDKSGNGRTVSQTTTNNQPTLTESAADTPGSTVAVINGRQGLFYDGLNDRLTSQATYTTTHARTIFCVVRTTSTSPNRASWSLGATSGSVVRLTSLEGSPTSGSKLIATDGAGGNPATTADRDSTAAHISCHSQSSARVLRYFLNGTSLALTSATLSLQTNFAGLTVGARSDGIDINLPGIIGELLFYDREISTEERNAITRYLGARWGITVA